MKKKIQEPKALVNIQQPNQRTYATNPRSKNKPTYFAMFKLSAVFTS